MGNKVIIGGGISGLIFQFYHPEFKIITPEVGGNFAKLHLVWLHDTVETRKLLTDLGYSNVDKLHKRAYMGYYNRGWIQEELSPELNLRLIQKKMTWWNDEIDKSFRPKTYDMSTVSAKTVNYMNVLDVDPAEIIAKIAENRDVKAGQVVSISESGIGIKGEKDEYLPYSELVTTMPAPVFWSMFYSSRTGSDVPEFKSTPITNVMTKDRPVNFDDKFEMVYYDETVPYSRISHIGDTYTYEFTGIITREEFGVMFPKVEVSDYLIVKYGRIFENLPNVSPQDNITFLGRFAQWEYGVTSEHVIKKTLEYEKSKSSKEVDNGKNREDLGSR